MTSRFKPDGYTSVAPYLIVAGAERTIAFLVQTFGAREVRRFPDADGRIMHAEVRIDDTIVMLADATWEKETRPHLPLGGVGMQAPEEPRLVRCEIPTFPGNRRPS